MKNIQELIKAKKATYKYFTETESLEAVKQDGNALQYVTNQTEQICLEAVKQYGYALQYVTNQTKKICLEAVKDNGYALQYVSNQTEEICLEAVKQNGYALSYVKEHLFIVEPKELTMKELSDILGYEVKIVK